MNVWANLRLTSRFMIIVGLGVVLLVTSGVLAMAGYERDALENRLRQLSLNEMTSLHALIVNVMAKRPEDGDNIGIQVFNNWFKSRNVDYPGTVWSAWGPKVTAFMAQTDPDRAPKAARDDVDREAFDTRKIVARRVDDTYRLAYPIVLGVTSGADQDVCMTCHHDGMGIEKGEVIAVLSSSLSTAAPDAALNRTLMWISAGGALATLLAVLGVKSILNRIIARPVAHMTECMTVLAQGDTSVDVPSLDRRDEVGDIGRAVQVFKQNTIAKHAMEAEAERAARARDERMHRLEGLIHTFETAVAGVLSGVAANAEQMTDTSGRMVSLADRAATGADRASKSAAEANENVRMVAAAAEELSSAINEIAQQVGMSNSVAVTATREAEGANTRVEGLAGAADRIGEIIAVITKIAEQTNLLALNATVEAARAGDAGKGFSVVAAEVKDLARQTVRATTQIADQITTIQGETRSTVDSIRGINSTIGSMDGITTAIAAAVEQQGAATQEIARNIDHAAQGTHSVFENITDVSQSIKDTDRAARDVLEAAKGLKAEAATLRQEVDRFLNGIRNV